MTAPQHSVLRRPRAEPHTPPAPGRPAAIDHDPTAQRKLIVRRWQPQPLAALLGVGAWAYGVSRLQRPPIGSYGLLANSNVWFVLGLVLLVLGILLELRRSEPRTWLLGIQLVAVVVAIHSTVPILYGTPEYAWVYKHIGIISAFQRYGQVTDPTSIYQQWPALFAAVAALSGLSHVAPATLATWAPLAFELADALLLLAIFRLLARDRRVAYLAVVLYEGVTSWVGQNYLSPQAFAYLLWLGTVLIILRWLRAGAPRADSSGRMARLRAPLLVGLPAPSETTARTRASAVALVVAIYFVIVAAHQLTPYVALSGVGALSVLGLVRPRWLLVLLAAVAVGYLAPRYSLIENNFGGLFSGGNPISNASGARSTYHLGPEATTAQIVRGLAAGMWLVTIAAIGLRRRSLGRVVIPAALAFSPFVILGAQSYGGEAIYRVYLFSAPWCALLIAGLLCELRFPRRLPLRWPLIAGVCLATLFAGLQGLYGPVAVDAFTPSELAASDWLYAHIPHGSLIVLPDDNFPALQTASYNSYDLEVMPADPHLGESWLDEGNIAQVERYIADFGHRTVYIAVSRSMRASADYFGAPAGYGTLVRAIPGALRGSAIYHNKDATVYRLSLS